MAKEDFIPVTGDDWYQRRRQDAEGDFFRKVADQGPRKGQGGSTRQGIYLFTTSGKLLGYKNAGQNAEVMRETLQRGLAEWKKLPAAEREPGAIAIADLGRADKQYVRTLPPGGVALNVYTRLLDRDSPVRFCAAKCEVGKGAETARDHLWIMPDERLALAKFPGVGKRVELPRNLVERIVRFHLVDNTRGEPPFWSRDHIRKSELSATVTEVEGKVWRAKLEGTVCLATDADVRKAERGFEGRLLGQMEVGLYSMISEFNLLAIGEHWGEGTYTRGARPGRTPLGIWFELAGNAPADLVPPQGAREWQEYLGRIR